jgi:hypothetical protein
MVMVGEVCIIKVQNHNKDQSHLEDQRYTHLNNCNVVMAMGFHMKAIIEILLNLLHLEIFIFPFVAMVVAFMTIVNVLTIKVI